MTVATLHHRPELGDYYLTIEKVGEVEADWIVVVAELNGRRIVVTVGGRNESRYYYEPEVFERSFRYLPDGEEFIKRRIAEEVAGIEAATAGSDKISLAIGRVAPHLEAPAEVSTQALVPAVTSIADAKAQVASVRNDVALMQLEVKRRQAAIHQLMRLQQERIRAILATQARDLEAKLGGLNEMLKKAEEAIWTINLYLGKDEEIVRIRKGKAAPRDSKIYIRQLVLYADEECAIDAESGGIDAPNIEKFDEWLKDPKHLQQVLPEVKGVVAIKPRRNRKNYGRDDSAAGAWKAAKLDEANKKTYFLMRNGDYVYRICTELEVGDHLIPRENEHAELFFDKKYNGEREPIFPGDRRYMEAMEKAEGLKKHYLRILLFLQGLLDRTAVFAPLPAPRLNLLNRNVYGEHLVFVSDAEKLLGTGRPTFKEWQAALNAKLDVGHRIMGAFHGERNGGLSSHDRYQNRGNSRLSPETAEYPKDCVLYTIESDPERGWFFRYARGDTVYRQGYRRGSWDRQESGPAKRRASCRILRSDGFILNFDDAKPADMEWYLNDRTNRHEYEEMFPLLRECLAIKKAEAKEEAPFRDLLCNEISKLSAVPVKIGAVIKEVDELVAWWKLKNKTHRALLSDDKKAFRMILEEHRQRHKRDAALARLGDRAVQLKERVLLQHREVVLIAHVKGDHFISLVAENSEDVYVREQEWRHNGEIQLGEVRPWVIPTRKRLLSWNVLYEAPRWASWKVDARESEHLTDPEIEELVKVAMPMAAKHVSEERYHGHRKYRMDDDLVAIAYDRGPGALKILYWTDKAKIPDRYLNGEWRDPAINAVVVNWTKKRDEVKPKMQWGTTEIQIPDDASDAAWSEDRVLRLDGVLLNKAIANKKLYAQEWKLRNELSEFIEAYRDAANAAMMERAVAAKKAEFIAEFEHEELWADHKKSIRDHEYGVPRPDRVVSAAMFHIDRLWAASHDLQQVLLAVKGISIGEMIAAARGFGWRGDKDDADKDKVPEDVVPSFEEIEERLKKGEKPWSLDDVSAAGLDEGFDEDDEDDGEREESETLHFDQDDDE